MASHPFRSSPWAVVLSRQGQDVCPLPAAGMPPVPGSKQTTADRPPQLASTRKGGSTLCHVVPSETTRMAAMLTSTVRVNPAGALGAFSPPSPPSCSSSGTATTGDGTRRRDGVGSSSGGGSSIGGSGSSSVVVVVAVATDVADSVVVGVEGSFPTSSPPPSPLPHHPHAPGLHLPPGGQSLPCQGSLLCVEYPRQDPPPLR